MTLLAEIDRRRFWGYAALFGAVALTALLAGCETPLVREVKEACANAPDRQACEDAEYARRYAIERQRLHHDYP